MTAVLPTRAFVLFTVCLALTGCALFRPPVEPRLKEATAEQLAGMLRERQSAVQTMKGLFRAHVKGPGIPIAQRLEGAMFFQRPDRLRLQGFKHGSPLFDLVVGQDVYRLSLPATGRVLNGRVDELDRIGELARPVRLSVMTIQAAVSVAPVTREQRVNLVEEGDRYRLDVFAKGPTGSAGSDSVARPVRRLWFDRRSLMVVREEQLGETGQVEATIQFEDFRLVTGAAAPLPAATAMLRPADGWLLPYRITTTDERAGGTLTLNFHEIVPNAPLKPEELGLVARGPGLEGDAEFFPLATRREPLANSDQP
jgi:hypothetical protein